MKKSVVFATALLSGIILGGCELTGVGNTNNTYDPTTATADPVKPAANTSDVDNSDNGDEQKPDSGTDNQNEDNNQNTDNNQQDNNSEGILPSRIEMSREFTEGAKYIDSLIAYDENDDVLWIYSTDEIGVGQYENSTDIGARESGYYYAADQTLYCIDLYSGNVKWKSTDKVGVSCSYDFDEDGNIYICGYEGPDLVVIDPDGKTLYSYESFTDKEGILNEFFWVSGLEYNDGKVFVSYENCCVRVVADVKTGEGHVEEFRGNADWSESALNKWEMKSWECSDGSSSESDKSTCKLEITDDYWMNFSWKDAKGKEQLFEYMPIVFKPVDLYDGIENDEYGTWCGCCQVYNDKNNSFAYQMTDSKTLKMIWFMFDDNGEPMDYTIITFTSAGNK